MGLYDSEKWKPVKGFEGLYIINKDGNVRTKCKEKLHQLMSTRIDRSGYMTVKLVKGKKWGTQYVHRLVAEAFIPNPDNKPMINHINGNKLDNRLENLEWVTHSQNMKHAYSKPVTTPKTYGPLNVIDRCTGEKYPSIRQASVAKLIDYDTLKIDLKRTIKKKYPCLSYAA